MTDHANAGARESYEAAVRSFTQAEVALGELLTAAQRFQSASTSIEQAQAGLELTREPPGDAIETGKAVARELEQASASLRSTSTVFAKLDPDRFWASLDALTAGVASATQSNALENSRLQRLAMQTRAIAVAGLVFALLAFGAVLFLLAR